MFTRARKHEGMLKTLPLPSDSYCTAHSKPHEKVGVFSGIRYAFHVQSRLKEPIAVMLGIETVRRFAPQKTGTCCTIKTQSLKDGLQSRLPQQATSRKQRGMGSAWCHSAQSIQSKKKKPSRESPNVAVVVAWPARGGRQRTSRMETTT